MTTVDNLLLNIVNSLSPLLEEQVSSRDAKILRSLALSVNNQSFLTENQANLLLKLLKENTKKLENFTTGIVSAIENPTWSKEFRKIEQVRKFFIGKNSEQNPILVIEFTFNSKIRKILSGMYNRLNGLSMPGNSKIVTAELTEKNIIALYEELEPHGFDIDPLIKSHYDTIRSWVEEDVRSQFLISNLNHKNFHQAITDDLGINTKVNQNLLSDRCVRYQYFLESKNDQPQNLTEIIANRSKPRIWIDKNKHGLDEVISSLIILRRMPLLVVVDSTISSKFPIEMLSDALETNSIYDRVGVHFRLPNGEEKSKELNQFISNKSYNYELVRDTQVAVLMNGKLPKFYLNSSWQPMSVIALDTKMGLRHGKTSIYANRCDLVIEWSDKETLFENKGC